MPRKSDIKSQHKYENENYAAKLKESIMYKEKGNLT
jgi:hypothetical protein